MKNILFLLLLISGILSCSTRKQSCGNEYYRAIVQAVDAAKEVKEEDRGDVLKALHRMEQLLRTLPEEQQQDDSLTWYVQDAFSRYYGLVAMSHEFSSSLRLLDSLAAAPTPFLKAHAMPELFALRSNLNLMTGQTGKAISLADSFCLLPPPEEAKRLVRYNEMTASTYFSASQLSKAIQLMKQAVDAYHKGAKVEHMGRVLAWLGVYYNQYGKYEDASQTNLEAIEYYEKNPEDRSTVVAYAEQANLYYQLRIMDKALEINAKAIECSQRNYNYHLSDAYRFRGIMLTRLGERDSAFYYIRKAIDIDEKMENQRGVWGSKLEMLRVCLKYPDSIGKANILIAQLCADSVRMPSVFKAKLNFFQGKAWMQSGMAKRATGYLEKATKLSEQIEMYDFEQEVRSALMDNYLQTGEYNRLAAGFKRYQYLTDSLNSVETRLMVTGANIRFDTQRKEQENRLLTTEVELKDSKLRNYAFTGIILFIIASCAGSWFWLRQRSLCLQLRLEEQEKQLATLRLHEQEEHLRQQEERLQQIIASRQELNRNNEELLRQLAEIQATHEKTCDLDQVMESLQPKLITSDEEQQFRTAFSSLYPAALLHLRTVCPRITHSEELLCMLILLKQTNEEISRTLGISRSSVLQSRYRLKQKLELSGSSELDDEIERIMLG